MKIFASKNAPLLLKPTVTDAILIVAEFAMMGFTRHELSRYSDGLREYSRLDPNNMFRDSALRQGICAFMMSRGMSDSFVYPAWLLLCSRTNVWRELYPDNLAAFPIRWGVIPERVETARRLADYSEEVLRVADELALWDLFGPALSRWDMSDHLTGVPLLAAAQELDLVVKKLGSVVANRDALLLWAGLMSGYAKVNENRKENRYILEGGLCYYCHELVEELRQNGMDPRLAAVSLDVPYLMWPQMVRRCVPEFKQNMGERGPNLNRLLASKLAGSFVFNGVLQIDTQAVTVNPESWLRSPWRVDISKGGNDALVF